MSHKKSLKSGFTTGCAASAAVKGALCLLSKGEKPVQVRIPFLSEGFADITVNRCEMVNDENALCTVIKDGGDDPDVTHGAEIGAIVKIDKDITGIRIRGGQGVGRVTKPGLGLELNGPAINPGPVRMIRMAVEEVLGNDPQGIDIEIFVKDGEIIARNTLNERLGIVGGISILGTTGIVRPMSHDAYIATIASSLSVASSAGIDKVVFTTGRRSERFAMAMFGGFPVEAFIQIGDFFKASLEQAVHAGMKQIILAVFFGKALKMAMGVPHTHAAKSDLSLDTLARWTCEISGDQALADRVRKANTARHAFEMIWPVYPGVIKKVGDEIIASARRFVKDAADIRCVIFDFEGQMICDSLDQNGGNG